MATKKEQLEAAKTLAEMEKTMAAGKKKTKAVGEDTADGKKILESSLLEPGAMFIVNDIIKDNTFSPGSLGFISFVRGLDDSYQNVAKLLTIMIRRGKSGKARIMNATLCVPVFNMDHEGFIKIMPQEGNRKYFMHIDRYKPLAFDIMKLRPLEFLGYAVAMAKRIKHMSDQCKHRKWPEAKSNPINVLKRMPDYFEEDPDGYLDKYGNSDFRQTFLMESRQMMSSLVRMHLQLDITRAETELNAAEFLLFTNEGEFIPKGTKDTTNEYRFTEDKSLLDRTIVFHKHLKDDIKKLYTNKKKKS
jgi:hypothetical protein